VAVRIEINKEDLSALYGRFNGIRILLGRLSVERQASTEAS